jgi:hypothetical protein
VHDAAYAGADEQCRRRLPGRWGRGAGEYGVRCGRWWCCQTWRTLVVSDKRCPRRRFVTATGGPYRSEAGELPRTLAAEEAAVSDNVGRQAAVEHVTWWMGCALATMSSQRSGSLFVIRSLLQRERGRCCEPAAACFVTCMKLLTVLVGGCSRDRNAAQSMDWCHNHIPAHAGYRSSTTPTQPVV